MHPVRPPPTFPRFPTGRLNLTHKASFPFRMEVPDPRDKTNKLPVTVRARDAPRTRFCSSVSPGKGGARTHVLHALGW